MLIRSIQDATLEYGKYGVAIQRLFNGREGLEQAAELYDSIASKTHYDFGRAVAPYYVKLLIDLAKQGKRIGTYTELMNLIDSLKQANTR